MKNQLKFLKPNKNTMKQQDKFEKLEIEAQNGDLCSIIKQEIRKNPPKEKFTHSVFVTFKDERFGPYAQHNNFFIEQEDELLELAESEKTLYLGYVIMKGKQIMILYTSEAESVETKINDWKTKVEKPIEVRIREDKDWQDVKVVL
jgi:hypothetical protein